MNLYLRYFDKETLVDNVDDALAFLCQIPEITITPAIEDDLRRYATGDVLFPKRYKVRPRVYFIVIKTEAANMTEFKQKKTVTNKTAGQPAEAARKNAPDQLQENRPGWYEGSLEFKRVVLIPATGKCEYRDTLFVADCKADSSNDCYERIVSYLKSRVDSRSQFPSAKGKNFKSRYLGACK